MPTTTRPDSLPAKLYLLAYAPPGRRLGRPDGSVFARLLRGAALAELNLRGLIRSDEGLGGLVRASGSQRSGDRVLDELLREIEQSRPRSWKSWIRRGNRACVRAVRDQLTAAGLVRIRDGRLLGLFPRTTVLVTDTSQVDRLRATIQDALSGREPAERVDVADAALVALAAVGELRSALSRQEARAHKARIAELTERGGDAVPALKSVLRQVKAARAAAASGG
jgi:hypothetical protein